MQNGTAWRGDDGAVLQGHGGAMLRHNGVWYWYGEDKRQGSRFGGFACCSSRDMRSWKNEGIVLGCTAQLDGGFLGERPSVVYHQATGRFVLWFHYDTPDYATAQLGLAVAQSPTGPFRFLGPQKPPNGGESRDMTVFADDDGAAYLVYSSEGNATLHIQRLTEDYLGFAGPGVRVFPGEFREAPVVLRQGGTYYMFTSGCTGWSPNPMRYAVSDSMLGPWRLAGNPCAGRADAAMTFGGQSAFAFQKEGRWFLALDHWNPECLGESAYSWLPVRVDGETAEILWQNDFE
jgi:beta-xylosidase